MLRFPHSLIAVVLGGVVATVPSASAADDPSLPPRIIITGEAGKKFAQKNGAVFKKHVKQMDLFSLEVADGHALKELIKKATAKGFKAETDQVRKSVGLRTGGDRKLAEEIPWGISKVYEKDGTPDIPSLDFFPKGADMSRYMCVIDSGYVNGHPDLPLAGNAGSGSITDTELCNYHGTHVAGTVQATGGNDEGVIGVYPGADTSFAVRVFRPLYGLCYFAYASDLIGAAYDCADAGAGVINMSLGGGAPTNAEAESFADLYYNKGVLPVAAAGNDANTAYGYPASYDAVMSVAATDINDNLAYFSQRNDQVEIGGPGVNVKSTIGPDTYATFSGTSMASPHVAAVALVLQNKFPTASTPLVRHAMNQGAIDLGAPGYDTSFGNGLVNYWKAEEIVADCDEGVKFQATYQGRDYDLPCQWILEQSQFPKSAVCDYPDGNAGEKCACVCSKGPTASPTSSLSPTPAPTVCEQVVIEVNVKTDDYPDETSWVLVDDDTGITVAAVDEADYFERLTIYEHNLCLPSSVYTYTIRDSYSDGICCEYGQGGYQVSVEGAVVASGARFGSSESTTFSA